MSYQTIKVASREHVVCESKQRGNYMEYGKPTTKIPEANYLGTRMALCGILDKGQSLSNWEKKRV